MSKRVQAPMSKRHALRRQLYFGRQLMNQPQPIEQVETGPDPEKLAMVEEQNSLREAVARQRAEFDNFRKRTQREKDQIRELASETLVSKLLPVLDNMDRALSSADATTDVKSVKEGVVMIMKQLQRTLESEGLNPVDALNQRFDPNLHDALATEENADVPEGHVCEVLLPGYTFKDKLLRAAMVKVAKAPSGDESKNDMDAVEPANP